MHHPYDVKALNRLSSVTVLGMNLNNKDYHLIYNLMIIKQTLLFILVKNEKAKINSKSKRTVFKISNRLQVSL